jgi:hypothetical protein
VFPNPEGSLFYFFVRNFFTLVILSGVEGKEGKEKFQYSLVVELLTRDVRCDDVMM